MKLLILGPEITDFASIRNYSGLWSYHLRQQFLSLGVELQFVKVPHDPFIETAFKQIQTDADHIFTLGNRLLSRLPQGARRTLRKKVPGWIAQLHDRSSLMNLGDRMFTFTVRPATRKPDVTIGWAADPTFFYPVAPEDGRIHVLIDHANYGGLDFTHLVWVQVARLIDRNPGGFAVHQIVDGGVAEVNVFEPPLANNIRYQRQSVPLEQIVPFYRQAHIFMPTHRESVGLSVLELAMCGALPVVRTGFIAEQLLGSVRHVGWLNDVNWDHVLEYADAGASRQMAAKHTWRQVALRILQKFNVPVTA